MKLPLLLILFFFSSSLSAKTEDAYLPVLMHSFYGTLLELRPYIESEDEFQSPKNREKISGLLKGLENKIDQNQVKNISKAPGFAVTYALLGSHIQETNFLFEHEIYGAAHNNLKATTGLCIMCHERLPKPAPLALGEVKPKPKAVDNLADAEFYYIAHNFDEALALYDSMIQKYDGRQKDFDFDQIYKRKIAYFARIQRSPKAAITNLKADAANSKLPKNVKKNINDWIHYFESWSEEGSKDPAKLSDEKFLAYAKAETDKNTGGRKIAISDPAIVNLLRVSGLLYERVFKTPNVNSTPEMLYLLAKCERDLSPIQKYSLADIYLRECVLRYPKSSVAKKCFNDYEVSMKQKVTFDSDYIKGNIDFLRRLMENNTN